MAPFGIILAGGRALRMGGGDKAVLALDGVPLIKHVIARLSPQCAGLALSANGDPARFSGFGVPVLPDSMPDHPGPLAGVLAGLDWAAQTGAAAIVTAAVDTPFLPDDLVDRLQSAAAANGLCLAASRDAQGVVQRHPTFGLWPVALRDDLRAALGGGARKVAAWADTHHAGQAIFDSRPFDPFFNINTPNDLAAAQAMIRQWPNHGGVKTP